MRISPRLVHIASILVATGCAVACGTSDDTSSSSEDAGDDAGSRDAEVRDAANDAAACSNPCNCPDFDADTTNVTITAAQACQILVDEIGPSGLNAAGPECQSYCPADHFLCGFPTQYADNFVYLNLEAGISVPIEGDGGDAGVAHVCPSDAGAIVITCYDYDCTGRLTEGYVAPDRKTKTLGDRFAAMAYLEAVSIHAFDRLERELHAHGAPENLLRDARRARRDEERHTKMMTSLAEKRGAIAQLPDARNAKPIRSRFEIALENAVEGRVRETYGALMGLVESEAAADPSLRKTMRAIAPDECRHADLAWSVHEWMMPQLTVDEANRVKKAMREAVAEIAARDSRGASLLFDTPLAA